MSRIPRKSFPQKNLTLLQNLIHQTPPKVSRGRFSTARRSVNIRIQSKTRSPSKESTSKSIDISRMRTMNFSKSSEQVSGVDLQNLFQAKCKDLEIPIFDNQKKRFFSNSTRFFKNRRFQLKEAGLALKSALCISKTIKKNPDFAYIVLSKNALGDHGGLMIAKALKNSLSLVFLDLSSNAISPKGSAKIMKVLTGHNSLVHLDLSSHEGFRRNRLAKEGSQAAGELLKTNQVLTMISLQGTSLGSQGLQYVMEGVRMNSELVELKIGYNNVQSDKIYELTQVVSASRLLALDLSGNPLGNQGCECLKSLLKGGFNRRCVLERLNLSRNGINSQGFQKILDGLINNMRLKELNFSENLLQQGLPLNFGLFLQQNKSLQVLDLSKSELRNNGLVFFQQGLPLNRALLRLNFSKNQISDKGSKYIAKGLAKNKFLTSLDLSFNKIRAKGGLAIGRSLKFNRSLQSINLRENYLNDQCGLLFSEVTRFNQNLIKVQLEYNLMDLKYLKIINAHTLVNFKKQKEKEVPRLEAVVQKLKIDRSLFHKINREKQIQQKAKQEMLQKFGRQVSIYNKIQRKETIRMNELELELERFQNTRIKLAEQLEEFEIEYKLTEKRSDRVLEEYGNSIAHAVYEIKKLEKESKCYLEVKIKEDFAMKRIELNKEIEKLHQQLYKAEVGLRSVEDTHNIATEKLKSHRKTSEQIETEKYE